jgi:uncharacterized protein YjdB
VTATSGDGLTGTATINYTVTAPVLQSIAVTPANPSIAAGTTKQFTATGTYSDNSTQNLTNQVTWASSNTAAATVDNTGLATGTATGTASISATLGAQTGSTTLTVTAPVQYQILGFSQPVPSSKWKLGPDGPCENHVGPCERGADLRH